MTVIVGYKHTPGGFFLYADSRLTSKYALTDNCKKLNRVGSFVVGICGAAYVTSALYYEDTTWVTSVEKLRQLFMNLKKDDNESTRFLAATKTNLYYGSHDGLVHDLSDKLFYAIGSGGDFAMGALAAGSTAREAVKIASDYDPGCGGPVVYMGLAQT